MVPAIQLIEAVVLFTLVIIVVLQYLKEIVGLLVVSVEVILKSVEVVIEIVLALELEEVAVELASSRSSISSTGNNSDRCIITTVKGVKEVVVIIMMMIMPTIMKLYHWEMQ